MRYSTQIKPISYLKANAAEVLQELTDQRQPMVITQNGEAKAVIQDVASWEFKPATRDGTAVDVDVVLEIPFSFSSEIAKRATP